MPQQLAWSHIVELLPLQNIQAINYYIWICKTQNLSYRELRERIKSNEYERIGYKQELEKPKINTLIKNPIIINTNKTPDNLTEYILHQLIIEDMGHFLKELGSCFAYIDSEVKIKIGNKIHRIDILLFNYKFNCFVVVELKITEFKAEYIGQVLKYINYVDENIKEPFNNQTVGVVICKKADKYILSYCTNPRIFTTTYKLKIR